MQHFKETYCPIFNCWEPHKGIAPPEKKSYAFLKITPLTNGDLQYHWNSGQCYYYNKWQQIALSPKTWLTFTLVDNYLRFSAFCQQTRYCINWGGLWLENSFNHLSNKILWVAISFSRKSPEVNYSSPVQSKERNPICKHQTLARLLDRGENGTDGVSG